MKQQTTRKKILHQVRDFQVLITENDRQSLISVSDMLEKSLNDITKDKNVKNIKYFIEK